jgi:AcrR family transcriptional regulator
MPKDTFFNLEESKKRKIILAAIKEFTEHELHKSRVSNIIKEADIPRGSFYQYFVDIDDLFYYVIDSEFEKIIKQGLCESEKTDDLFEFVKLSFIIDYKGYLNNIRNRFMKNVFKSIGNNYEYLEYHNSKRRQYILDVLNRLDLSNIKPMSDDELIDFYEFLQGIKRNILNKAMMNNQSLEESSKKLEWILNIIENGVRIKE